MSEFTQTTITVQGNDQEAYEVYADESMEQTMAFCFDEEIANLIPATLDLYTTCKNMKAFMMGDAAPPGTYEKMMAEIDAVLAKVKE